jgi:hypothetical protein
LARWAVGVHRPDDEAAAVQPEHDPILGGAVGRQPHGGHSAGVDLEVVDPARLGGSLAPLLDQLAPLVERQLAPLGENLAPTLVEVLYGVRSRICHRRLSRCEDIAFTIVSIVSPTSR